MPHRAPAGRWSGRGGRSWEPTRRPSVGGLRVGVRAVDRLCLVVGLGLDLVDRLGLHAGLRLDLVGARHLGGSCLGLRRVRSRPAGRLPARRRWMPRSRRQSTASVCAVALGAHGPGRGVCPAALALAGGGRRRHRCRRGRRGRLGRLGRCGVGPGDRRRRLVRPGGPVRSVEGGGVPASTASDVSSVRGAVPDAASGRSRTSRVVGDERCGLAGAHGAVSRRRRRWSTWPMPRRRRARPPAQGVDGEGCDHAEGAAGEPAEGSEHERRRGGGVLGLAGGDGQLDRDRAAVVPAVLQVDRVVGEVLRRRFRRAGRRARACSRSPPPRRVRSRWGWWP